MKLDAIQTVEYWLHKRKSIEEFDEQGHAITSRKGGYVLVFKFVRVDKVHLTTGLLTFKLYMPFSNIQDIATPVERTKFGINSKQN